MSRPAYFVDPRRCIRCGACATIAGDLFAIDGPVAKGPSRVLKPEEERRCEAAVLLCPTSAVRREGDER